MYEILYTDDGLCLAEEKRGETALWEEKFVEENHDSYAFVLKS